MGYQVVKDPYEKLKMLQGFNTFVAVPLFMEDFILNEVKTGKTNRQVKSEAKNRVNKKLSDKEREIYEWINSNPEIYDKAHKFGFRVEVNTDSLSKEQRDLIEQERKKRGFI